MARSAGFDREKEIFAVASHVFVEGKDDGRFVQEALSIFWCRVSNSSGPAASRKSLGTSTACGVILTRSSTNIACPLVLYM